MKIPFILLPLFLLPRMTVGVPISEVEPSRYEDPRNAAEYKLYKAGTQSLQSGDMDKSTKLFYESLKINPHFFPSMIGLAEVEDRKGHRQNAEQHLQAAFHIAPESAMLFTAYGKFLFRHEDIKEAITAFEKAIAINRNQAEAYAELAVIYLSHLNQPLAAINYYQKAIALSPENMAIRYGLSAAQAQEGQLEEAVATLKLIAERLPDSAKPWHVIGVYYARAEHFQEAIDAYLTALGKDPNAEESIWLLAEAYTLNHQYQDSINTYRRIMDRKKNIDIINFRIGLNYHLARDFKNAESFYLKSLTVNQGLSDALNNLAQITIDTHKEYKQGLAWASSAVELAPRNGTYLDTLGWIYFQLGKHREAVSQLTKSVSIDPSSAEAYRHLSEAYKALGNKKDAEKYLERSRQLTRI